MTLNNVWTILQYPVGIIGVYQIIKWLLLLTPFGKKIKFRYEIYKIAHNAQKLFLKQNKWSIPEYLAICRANIEAMFISDFWYYSYFKSPFPIAFFSEPEKTLCIINHAREFIKKVNSGSKPPEYKEIYEQMLPRFNSFCEELEKVSKKFPNFCEGLSSIEKLPALHNDI